MSRGGRLLVIVPDRVSHWIDKGEVVERYFNPGNVFDEVHLALTNDDRPDRAALQPLAGDADVVIHNIPAGPRLFAASLAWRPPLLRRWARRWVPAASEIAPRLIRCYGASINAVVASEVRRSLGIPYVVSLHGNPDIDYFRGRRGRTRLERLVGRASLGVELMGLRDADLVLPVYSTIVPYLEAHGLDRWEVVYNVVGHAARVKTDHRRSGRRLRAVCVGRQEPLEKDPAPIIDAVIDLPDVELLLIGDGALHDGLVGRASSAADRISFVRSMPNDDVLETLADSDVFVYSSHNYELSKTVIEACLTALPVVANDRDGDPAAELVGGHVVLVDGSAAGYREALHRLTDDGALRATLGRRAHAHALASWSPEVMEQRLADLYRRLALPG